MFIVQLLLALALLGGSGSSNDATFTQLEVNPLQPHPASPELVLESGLKPFRSELTYKGFDPDYNQYQQAAKILTGQASGKRTTTTSIQLRRYRYI